MIEPDRWEEADRIIDGEREYVIMHCLNPGYTGVWQVIFFDPPAGPHEDYLAYTIPGSFASLASAKWAVEFWKR